MDQFPKQATGIATNTVTLIFALLVFSGCGLETTQPGLHLEPTMTPPVLGLFNEATEALRSGDLEKAREKYQKALEVAQKLGDDAGIGHSLAGLGSVYSGGKEYPQALAFFSDALPYFRKARNLAAEGWTLANIGEVHLQMSNPKSAIEAFNGALAIGKTLLSRASEQERRTILGVRARVYFEKAKSHQALGQDKESVESYRLAATDFQNLGEKKLAGTMLWTAGDILRQKLKAPNEAIEAFSQATSLLQEAGDTTNATWTRLGLALSYKDAERFDEAGTIFSDVVKAVEHTGSSELLIQARFWLGRVLEARGRFEEALSQYETILQLVRKGQGIDATRWEANVLALMGDIDWYLSRYEEAIEHLQGAAIKYHQVANTEAEAGVLNKLAEVFFWVGDASTAIQEYKRAVELYKQMGNLSKEVEVLAALGESGWLTGQIPGADADEYFKEAQKLVASFSGVDPVVPWNEETEALFQQWQKNLSSIEPSKLSAAGALFQRYGRVQLEYGRVDEAVRALSFAVLYHYNLPASRERLFDSAKDYYFLGEASRRKRNFGYALQNFQTAEQIAQLIRSPEIHWVHAGLARTQADLGNTDTALQYYRAALQTLEDVRGLQVTEEVKIGVLGGALYVYRGLVSLLLDVYTRTQEDKYVEEAFQINERLRARSFLENLTKARARKLGGELAWLTDRQLEIERQVAQIHHQLRAPKLDQAKETRLLDELEGLRKSWRTLQEQAAKSSPRYARLAYPKAVTVTEVQHVLDPDSVLLEYSVSQDASTLWVITKEQVNAYRLPGQEAQSVLERYLETLRQPLMTPDEISAHVALGKELYKRLVGPAEKLILGKNRIIIAPDGPLYYLPFEALIVAGRSARRTQGLAEIPYLIKTFQVAYTPSASILVEQRRDLHQERGIAQLPFVAFGDPVYGNKGQDLPEKQKPPTQAGFIVNITLRGLNLNPLEFSGREVRRIASIWGVPLDSEHINLRSRASVARVRELDLSKYRIVHFATHAVAGDEIGFLTQPALILSQAEGQRGDRGILQFGDIMQLRLNADLVVLSACDTGLGRLREGEGIVGLTRAFLYAGAASTVSSLWKVEDQSTSLLMEGFYRRLKQGQSKAEALRQAKLELLQSRIELKALGMRESLAAPFYWAPFVLMGDWEPMRRK